MSARNHDEFIQSKGQVRGQRLLPQQRLQKPNQAPQAPNNTMKTNAYNQYRGHGRGQ